MSDDLVARLRAWWREDTIYERICIEAADEIERLRAQTRLHSFSIVEWVCGHHEQLAFNYLFNFRKPRNYWKLWNQFVTERAATEARLEKLRKAVHAFVHSQDADAQREYDAMRAALAESEKP